MADSAMHGVCSRGRTQYQHRGSRWRGSCNRTASRAGGHMGHRVWVWAGGHGAGDAGVPEVRRHPPVRHLWPGPPHQLGLPAISGLFTSIQTCGLYSDRLACRSPLVVLLRVHYTGTARVTLVCRRLGAVSEGFKPTPACVVQSKWAAQRALDRNGERLSSSLMVGVQRLGALHRQAVQQYAAAPETPAPLAAARAKTPISRHYHIDATASKVRSPFCGRSHKSGSPCAVGFSTEGHSLLQAHASDAS